MKVGDFVTVTAGFHKAKTGEILAIYPKSGKLIVKGINLKFKHLKSKNEDILGEIKQVEAPIHHSNVILNSKKLT